MPDDTDHPDNAGSPESEKPTSVPGDPPSAEDDLIAAARMAADARSDGLPPEPDLPPPDFFPGYVVAREIHRGGQGIVYQAVHKGTKRKVAIKVMLEGALASVRERTRFEREVEILAQLDHPCIVNVHDSGAVEGRFYYVMDYISGTTLDVWIGQQDLSIGEVLELFAQICDAVNAAHLKGVIHRDLKPANVRVDASGRPHIVDFGLAKTVTGSFSDDEKLMTMTGQFLGSLPWASPEQAQGVPGMIDVRTDVYSLGVMLYQMLTGRFPYQVVGNMRDILDNILRTEPARPSTVRRQINDEVETIVLKCLSKERDRRYQNAGDLGRDIGYYLRGEPIEAKRDSGWYVLKKTARRYRGAVTSAAVVLVLLVGFAIAISVMYGQKKRALAAEQQEAAAKQEVIDTLETWFTAPDPTEGDGKDVTVRDVLDKAAGSIGEHLGDQPRVEAALRRVIGATYFNLGLWPEAEPHLRRARELAEKVEGPDGEMTVFAEQTLGVVLQNLQRPDEAEPLLIDALERSRRLYGGEHQRTVTSLNDLAQHFKQTGELDKAEPLLREAVDGAEAIGDQTLMGVTQANLAELILGKPGIGQAEIDEATSLFTSSVAAIEADLGADHPHAARARLRLGRLLDQTGHPDEAMAEYRQAVEVLEAKLGPAHADTLGGRHYLAMSLDGAGQKDEALEIFRQNAEAAAESLPPDHPFVAWYRYNYGAALLEAERYEEARPLLESAAEFFRAADHPVAPRAIDKLAKLYEAIGQDEKAEALRSELAEGG